MGVWAGSLLAYGVENDRAWAVASGSVLGGVAGFAWVSNVAGAVRGAKRANRHRERRQAEAALRETSHPDLERHPEDVTP